MYRGNRSVVLKNRAAGVPRWNREFGGGLRKGQRYIQYSPPNGMVSGRAGCESPGPPPSAGAISVVTGLISGQRITPGKLPGMSGLAAAVTGRSAAGVELAPPAGVGIVAGSARLLPAPPQFSHEATPPPTSISRRT